MSDERVLFDRAARPMRPELLDRLDDLYELLAREPAEAVEPRATTVVVELGGRPQPSRRPGRRASWLLVAASVAALLAGGLIALSHTSGRDRETGVSPGSIVSSGVCGAATPLGQVSVGAGTVLVAGLGDGRFCLDDGLRAFTIGTTAGGPAVTTGTLIDAGPLDATGGYFYLFEIPPNVPVNVVIDESGKAANAFANPVGRRLLIVEGHVAAGSVAVQRAWELRSSSGDAFGSVTAVGPLPANQAGAEQGTTS